MKGEIFMSKAEIQALTAQVAAHDVFGDFHYFENDDEEIWWVAKDVCKFLSIRNHKDAVSRLDEDEKDEVGITDPIGRVQKTLVVNESGLYHLIFMSRKPAAKKFRKWVTSEVLPSIRKYGYYSLVNEKFQDREYLYKMLPTLTEEEKFNLINEPDIVVWKTADDEEWRVSIDGFPDVR